MNNLEQLYSTLGQNKELTIRTLEDNLGFSIGRESLLDLSDEEFLLALSDEYRHIFFSKIWTGPMSEEVRTFRNEEIVKIINKNFNRPIILDIGCGFNHFRKYFKDRNFIGIDPSNDRADLMISFDQYLFSNKNFYDVIICQGNLHFGTKETVEENIKKVVNILKSNGLLFVRFNVNKVPTLYPYLDIVADWNDIPEVINLFNKYLIIESEITVDNSHRIEFYGRKL